MRGFLNPKWIFAVNTIPIIVLFFLFTSQISLISSLLNESNIRLLISFGVALGILGVSNFIYAAYLIKQKRNIHALYGIITLVCFITFIYLHIFKLSDMLPFSFSRWMISEDIYFYASTFLMPTLCHAFFVLILRLTPDIKSRTQASDENESPSDAEYSAIRLTHKAWMSFLIAIAIPFLGYLFAQVVLPLWQPIGKNFDVHAILILIIIATLLFLFFLIRGLYILTSKRTATLNKYQYIWKIPVTILFPLLGLLVNNGYNIIDIFGTGDTGGVFGNFCNYWFYILAILNGTLLCMPNLKNKYYRLFLFIGRCITFAYSLYFFLVLLPVLPVSVVAIIAAGIGFLMLTPLLLFIIHVNEISSDFKFLKSAFSPKIAHISAMSFLVIPIIISANYLQDRYTLNKTLNYIYNSDYSKNYNINKASLRKTLDAIKSDKDNQTPLFSAQLPYLSSYYKWLVLDNLTLSDSKINLLERIFFGESSYEMAPNLLRRVFYGTLSYDIAPEEPLANYADIRISDIKTNSVFDNEQQVWKSWIDIEITNHSDNTWDTEYATEFELPEGCWISDYYLYVGDIKEPGILAEKKSAMWLFSQIRNENRDPGILHYTTGKKIAFKVFPFQQYETRKTGIEFLHKEPVTLNIDDRIITLGETNVSSNQIFETENMVYIPGTQKMILKPVTRKPYFHFLIDVSTGKNEHIENYTKYIEQISEIYKVLSENAKVSFVNSYVSTTALNEDWKQKYQTQTFDGGFYLDRAIKTALIEGNNSESYPVIVVVTDDIQKAILDKDFSDLEFTFPENNLFFHINDNETVKIHSLIRYPQYQFHETTLHSIDINADILQEITLSDTDLIYTYSLSRLNAANITVREYILPDNTTAYLSDNNAPDIILKKDIFKIHEPGIKEKNWLSALTMEGKWRSQILHPETSDKEWLNMVKYSFKSKIMTPFTSYLVVENEAQRAVLKKKQEQVLSGNKSLDPGEDGRRMSEPGMLFLILILGLVIWCKEKRKRQKS